MTLYIVLIAVGDFLIFGLNFCLGRFADALWTGVIVTLVQPVLLIFLDGLAALAVRRLLPERYFQYKRGSRPIPKWELKLYRALGIRHWKDSILELGMFTAFSKKTLATASVRNAAYLDRFILESKYGIWCHASGAALGFVILFAFKMPYRLCVALPAAILNAVLSLLPLMVLRYNLPRLYRLRERATK